MDVPSGGRIGSIQHQKPFPYQNSPVLLQAAEIIALQEALSLADLKEPLTQSV
jgi:hypothetical protein